MIGRRGIAPCGHPGEHIVGNYVRCDKGCDDAVPEHVDFERTNRELYDEDQWFQPCPPHDWVVYLGGVKCLRCGDTK